MILSKERLLKEKKDSGYRQEIIEADDSYLATRLTLKGGTALNLFHFNLPRLSVDADLNYIGAVDRETGYQSQRMGVSTMWFLDNALFNKQL